MVAPFSLVLVCYCDDGHCVAEDRELGVVESNSQRSVRSFLCTCIKYRCWPWPSNK